METKLKFIVDTNAIALHLLDYASNWHYYVHENIGEWVDKNVVEKDRWEKMKTEYALARKEMGWKEEINLLNWATADFPENIYPKLKTLVKDWFEVKLKNGQTIKHISQGAAEEIELGVKDLEMRVGELKFDEDVRKLRRLFDKAEKIESLPLYLLWSPVQGSVQGGANGMGIYTEVNTPLSEKGIESAFQLLVHETFHKLVNPSKTLTSWAEINVIDKKYSHLQEGQQNLSGILEELVIYTAVDVSLFGKDPKMMIKKSDKNPKYREMWQLTEKFAPVLEEYMDGQMSAALTKEKIISFAQKIVTL